MSYIKFENIIKTFGNNKVLKGINLEVEQGSFVTLLGPSGCGKSTLLRCLAGLEQVTEGNIFLDGEDITYKEPKDRQIGMVFQQYSLFPNMTVFENIAFGLKMKKLDGAEIDEKVRAAIAMVNLEGKEGSLPAKLSGGQQQRVALARSLVTRPKVLLLDEPFSAIDAKLRKSLQTEVRRIQQEMGITTIFVTHDQDEAMLMSDVIHLFNGGSIEQSGTPTQLYTLPQTSFAAGFIGNYNVLSQNEFTMMLGRPYEDSLEVAIRPETVELSLEPKVTGGRADGAAPGQAGGDAYHFEAVVLDHMPRGNVLRYRLSINGVQINADVLFRSKALFEDGGKVFVTIYKRNCVPLFEETRGVAIAG